jgi:hypothetical protein
MGARVGECESETRKQAAFGIAIQRDFNDGVWGVASLHIYVLPFLLRVQLESFIRSSLKERDLGFILCRLCKCVI